MTMCIPGSILTLTSGGVLKEEREGVRNSVDTFMQRLGSPYTLYLPTQSSHVEDPLSATWDDKEELQCMTKYWKAPTETV
jgi:hypothetical protein